MGRTQDPGGDYGYDLAHQDVQPQDDRSGVRDETASAAPGGSSGDRSGDLPGDLSGDLAYDEAHDF